MTVDLDERTSPSEIERRAELLAVADVDRLRLVAERCLADLGEPVLVEAPTTGIVMMQVREPVVGDRFHLGEVVVTRADISLSGERGWAMRLGTDRAATLAAAICDAAARVGGPAADVVDELLDEVERERRRAARELTVALGPPVVEFEELD